MADVSLALRHGPGGTSKLVVVKQLLPEFSGQPLYRQMFLDEARIAARMNHPNVVQAFDVIEEGGELLLTMEHLEGQSFNRVLRELARRDLAVRPELLVRVMSDALAGLHYAHELTDFDGSPLGIVHRDVSPHNLFVTYEGQVKVVDFGIAKTEVSSVKTAAGVLKGKAAYMAPEQLSGDPVDRRADVFTAGTILWEALTKRRLMAAGTQVKTILRVLNEPVPRVAAYAPNVDPVLERIVARALEREPSRRYPTARAMREALEDWLAKAPPVRPEHLGKLMHELFDDVRAHTAMQIRERLAKVAPSSTRIRAALDVTRAEGPGMGGAASRTSDPPTSLSSPRAMRRAIVPEVRVHPPGRIRGFVFSAALLVGLAYAGHVASTPNAVPTSSVTPTEWSPPSVGPMLASRAPRAENEARVSTPHLRRPAR